jgi:tetratricopeptide (TPR) repeat protein
LVALFLAAALAVQDPQVSATVDRAEALVGDVITLTIRIQATGNEPVRLVDPVLSGFQVRGSHEATQVRIVAGVPQRTVTRELRLVVIRAGTASIGPVRVRWGESMVETASISVAVSEPVSREASALAPRVRTLVNAASPPLNSSDVVVQVLAVPDSVPLGRQLDLVTLAWFPREIRTQLRTPPTLIPPDVDGVWAYQQTTPTGIVESRRVGQQWYDLFISHQVLFPLSAGELRVGPAIVSYVLPLTYSFLSRELQHEVQSESLTVAVADLPAAGQPAGFVGAAGSSITLALDAAPRELRPGGAATVTVTLEGVGNVALWPEAEINWPAGLRVYPEDVSFDVVPEDGLIAGTKRFSYLVVADSAGTHAIPGIRYPYFDPGRASYRSASAPGTQIIAPPGTMPLVARPEPPPLMVRQDGSRLIALVERAPPWTWWLVAILPPLLMIASRRLPRLNWRRSRPAAVAPIMGGELDRLDGEFRAALTRLVDDAAHREGQSLTDALRAAGMDPALAAHAVRVRDRLRYAVFGPAGTTDHDELSAEVREVLRALAGEEQQVARHALLPLAVMIALCVGSSATAQVTSAERLYQAGALRAAADAFLEQAAAEPDVAANWHNLGNAFYRLGEDGRARVAWLRALRIEPRGRDTRRALDLLPDDPITRRVLWTAPVREGEILIAVLLAWVLGWVLVGIRRAPKTRAVLLGLAVLGAVGAWQIDRGLRRQVAVVVVEEAPLRVAPFGSANAPRTLVMGSAVWVHRTDGQWLLVERAGTRGWVLLREVARL